MVAVLLCAFMFSFVEFRTEQFVKFNVAVLSALTPYPVAPLIAPPFIVIIELSVAFTAPQPPAPDTFKVPIVTWLCFVVPDVDNAYSVD